MDPRLRELVILRIAVLNRADYEWHAHESVARQCGIPDAEITAVRHGPEHPDFESAERAVLAYTDAMTHEVAVGPEVYGAVERLLPRVNWRNSPSPWLPTTWSRDFSSRWKSPRDATASVTEVPRIYACTTRPAAYHGQPGPGTLAGIPPRALGGSRRGRIAQR
ncbi:MAG: carboxymuconolactone decarboxylase family protein [Trebonia sp.]